jgi:hypothetical protein
MVAQVVLIAFRDLIFDTFIIRNFVRRTPEPGVSGSDVEFVSLNFLRCCVPDKGSGESMMNADFELDGVFVKRQRAKLFEVGSIGVVHTTLGARSVLVIFSLALSQVGSMLGVRLFISISKDTQCR